jgi:ankyrin repeat protein
MSSLCCGPREDDAASIQTSLPPYTPQSQEASRPLSPAPSYHTVDAHHGTPPRRTIMLFVAIWHQKTALAILLLLSGAPVNAQWEDRITPIHCAALKDNITMIKILVKTGANIESKEEHGLTPLDLAAMRGHTKAVKYLISRGAKIDNTVVRRAIPAPSISEDGGHL